MLQFRRVLFILFSLYLGIITGELSYRSSWRIAIEGFLGFEGLLGGHGTDGVVIVLR